MTAKLDREAFAREWIAAWNSHDLDSILAHYDESVVLVSPAAAAILNEPSGMVIGKSALREYFRRGLELYPNLHFELLDAMFGLASIVLFYWNQKGTKAAEYMEIGKGGKIVRVVANYSS